MQITGRQTQFAPSFGSVKHWTVAAVQTLLLWQERASQRHRIAGLDERSLKDVGLSRADAESEATKPFWQG